MDNLTKSLEVVKVVESPSPIEGHKVVIFRENRKGVSLEKVLNPKDKPFKTGLLGKFSYIAYAVNFDPNLNFHFSIQVVLSDQIHDFTLHCNVYFNVSNPEPIIVRLKNDPMNLIKEEISRIFRNSIKKKAKWEDISECFEDVSQYDILSEKNMERIQDFASGYGVNIKSIELDYSIPEKFLEVDIVEDEYKRKKKIDTIEQEKDRNKKAKEIADQEQKNRLQEMEFASQSKIDLGKRVVDAVDRMVAQINSPESFKKAAAAARETFDVFLSTRNNQEPAQISSSIEEVIVVTETEKGPFDKAINKLKSIASSIEKLPCDAGERKLILSITTHLLAELYLEEEAEPEIVSPYFEKLKDHFVDLGQILPHDFVTTFTNFQKELEKLASEYNIMR